MPASTARRFTRNSIPGDLTGFGATDMALSNAERQRRFRKRRRERAEANRERGKHRLEVWVSGTTKRRLQALTEEYGSEQKAVETAIRKIASQKS